MSEEEELENQPDDDFEKQIEEALAVAENESSKTEPIDKRPEIICPKCSQTVEYFYEKTYGWVECPQCSKSIRITDFKQLGIPSDVPLKQLEPEPEPVKPKSDRKMSRRKKPPSYDDYEDDDDDLYDDDEEEEYKNDSKESMFATDKKEHWQILEQVLRDYRCKEKFVRLMVKKAQRLSSRGPIHPTELYKALDSLDSGIKNKKAVKIVVEDYQEALDAYYDNQEGDDNYTFKDQRYTQEQGGRRRYSFEPDQQKRREMTPESIAQIIEEKLFQKEKRDDIDRLRDEIRDLKNGMRDDEGSQVSELQQQILDMQEQFNQQLMTIQDKSDREFDLQKMKMDWERERQRERERREQSDKLFQMMLMQQQNQDQKLSQSETVGRQREQQVLGLLIDTMNKDRTDADRRVKDMSEARKHGDYENDEIRLTAHAMDRIAKVAEKREPMKHLMEGLYKISKPTPLPTPSTNMPPPERIPPATEEEEVLDEDDMILSAFSDEDIVE